jgi:hypothetical protein
LLPVVYQDPVTDLDTFVTDINATGTVRRIRDECIYLVLGFAAKRTSDFILFVALAEHDPSMPRARRKSRCAKVEVGLLIEVRLCGVGADRKMLSPTAKRLLASAGQFWQISC